jgi:hypothetical protein
VLWVSCLLASLFCFGLVWFALSGAFVTSFLWIHRFNEVCVCRAGLWTECECGLSVVDVAEAVRLTWRSGPGT